MEATHQESTAAGQDPELQKKYSMALRKLFKQNLYRKFGPSEKANIDQMRNMAKHFGNP